MSAMRAKPPGISRENWCNTCEDKENARNHCNVGNGQLALDTVCSWIGQIGG